MKKLIFIQLMLLFPFLVGAFTSPPPVMSPLKGNWLNPMTNIPEDLDDSSIQVFLNSDYQINIILSVTTTDSNMESYPPMVLYWDFKTEYTPPIEKKGMSDIITQSDLKPIGGGLFKYSERISFDYTFECNEDEDGSYNLDIEFGLKTPKSDVAYEPYPMVSNPGLFNPVIFSDLSPTYTTTKLLLCENPSSPEIVAPNENPEVESQFGNSTNLNVQYQPNEIKSNQLVIDQLSAYPNPFSNELYLSYNLEEDTDIQLRIMDMSGNQIVNQNLSNQAAGKHTQNLSFDTDLPPGVYTIQLYSMKELKTVRIVKLQAFK